MVVSCDCCDDGAISVCMSEKWDCAKWDCACTCACVRGPAETARGALEGPNPNPNPNPSALLIVLRRGLPLAGTKRVSSHTLPLLLFW